jgi:glutathione synthase/RimK-type ligase-like ATP-grasp enzyme
MRIKPSSYRLALLTDESQMFLSKIPWYGPKTDEKLLIKALKNFGVETHLIDWKSKDVKWEAFDAALIFSTWDYHKKSDEFLAKIQKIHNLGVKVLNPPEVIKWNSSKTYLKDLENLGLKPIETMYISASCLSDLDGLTNALSKRGWDDCVVKPQVSASAYRTNRFQLSDPKSLKKVQEVYQNPNEKLMIQPFAKEILSEGEWSFLFFNNEYQFCVLKTPPKGHFLVQRGTSVPAHPEEWMIREAKKIVDTLRLPTVQTRVDCIRRGSELRIMEIEMIEPRIFLNYFPGSEKKLARFIRERLDHPELSFVLPHQRSKIGYPDPQTSHQDC